MKIAKLRKIDKKAVTKVLFENGYTNEYENDVIIDVLENRYNECFTKSQVDGIKLFYPNANVKKIDEHTYIVTIA